MNKKITVIEQLLPILQRAWSLYSSSKWTQNNPAKGQCGVTALIINDIFGGEIFKTPEGWHFYNKINQNYHDLTASQFSTQIQYLNVPSNRVEAFNDTNEKQYGYLKEKIYRYLKEDR
ncbi:hypothetical protein [Bacillus sp. CECT 9360]|uniref:YunG family protein n=1 Tax=Bacillus sp. CECT 9360 TaxID=2845821 RepID=UPI001E2E6F5F|nr:hypothetical protein [Bacillus sp. CECT 9360]CAH0344029.1 hypothetical protein BCI9360_00260 [Bacillus sp. CECT 9360]